MPSRTTARRPTRTALLALAGLAALPLLALAEDSTTYVTDDRAPVARALEIAGPDVQRYDQHITTLANPFMQGRLPGTVGIERAAQYIQFYIQEEFGLEPVFDSGDGYRQAFQSGSFIDVTERRLQADLPSGEAVVFRPGRDFNVLGTSGNGFFTAPVTFVGYSIEQGPEGYSSYPDEISLRGQWAMIARYEPMTDDGRSQWTRRNWSPAAGLTSKFQAAVNRGAAGIILVNPPETGRTQLDDERSVTGPTLTDVPVIHMSYEAADRLLRAGDEQGRGFTDLRRLADEGHAPVRNASSLSVGVQLDRRPITTDNVGALLPGRGALADEYIIIGAHYDHLGPGYFGSRSPSMRGTIHPGADDNASGSAAVLLIAEKLAETYANLPEDADARSVIFLWFTAEESGLHGARYYVNNPARPLEQTMTMINLDMVGRIRNDRLSVSGTGTAEGFLDLLQPDFDASDLEIVLPTAISGRSDHWPFYQAGLPVLFAIIADFHDDYHTTEDVSWKINRTAAAKTANLFHDITHTLARHPDRLTFTGPSRGQQQASVPPMGRVSVRVGIAPGNYDGDGQPGILVADVSEGTSADEAGIQQGDRITAWNGRATPNVETWMPMLTSHQPGDKVLVTIQRGDEHLDLEMTLKARETGG